MVAAKCTYCGVEYQATLERMGRPNKNGPMCSSLCACRMRWKLQGVEGHSNNVCEQCGKTFYRSPKHVARVRRSFCSNDCKSKASCGAHNPAYRGEHVSCECPICNTTFLRTPSHLNRIKSKPTCSQECFNVWLAGESSPLSKNLGHVNCIVCGIEVKNRHSGQIGKERTCSHKCGGIIRSQIVGGENNGRYVHGKALSPYPAEFDKARRAARKRDGNICQLCWTADNYGRKGMDVHHIDYDKDNSDLTNLVCLCRVCHGSMHGGKLRRRQLTRFWRRTLDSAQLKLGSIGLLHDSGQRTSQAELAIGDSERISFTEQAARFSGTS